MDIHKNGSYRIGFQVDYFTLWYVSDPYQVTTGGHSYYIKQDFTYIKNLSMVQEEAIEKACKEFKLDGITVDLSLRGASYVYRSPEVLTYEDHQFTFGNLKGEDIRQSLDTWQLNRAMLREKNYKTKEFAKARLIELGYLLEFRGSYITQAEIDCIIEAERDLAIATVALDKGESFKL